MIEIMNDSWIADVGKMACRNLGNGVRVVFQRVGNTVAGKVDFIPRGLLIELAEREDGADFIGRLVREAEDVFFRAYSINIDIN
jgi:hypothetical protein